jgi:hypothetical protein
MSRDPRKHLTEDEIINFVLEELSEEMEEAIDHHLERCAACTELLEDFYAAQEAFPAVQWAAQRAEFVATLHQRLFDRPRRERQIWELVEQREGAAAVVRAIAHRVWPPETDVWELAAGTTGILWKTSIALPPLVVPERDVRIELEVLPIGSPRLEPSGQPSAVPDLVKLQATATTLSGEPLENLSLTVRLGGMPVVSGQTDDEGAIASDVFEGEKLSEPLTVEVHDEARGTGQHTP